MTQRPPRPPRAPSRPPHADRTLAVAAVIAVVACLVLIGVIAALLGQESQPTQRRVPPAALQVAASPASASPPQPRPTAPEPVRAPDMDSGPQDGCGEPLPFVGAGNLTDVKPGWTTFVPSDFANDVPAPLLILVHGEGRLASDFLSQSGATKLADEHGIVVISLESEDSLNPWEHRVRHLRRARQAIDETARQLCIDRARIYAAGEDHGGQIVHELLCAGLLAGGATFAAGLAPGTSICPDSTPLNFVMLYPKESGYEPFDGGQSASGRQRMSYNEIVDTWRGINGCSRAHDRDKLSASTCQTFTSCEHAPLTTCALEGGRGWPGTPRRPLFFRMREADGPMADRRFPIMALLWSRWMRTPL